MTRPAPEYLIFDLDGTLIDSLSDLAATLNLLREELQLAPLSGSEISPMIGDGATLLVQRGLGPALYQPRHLARFMELYATHLLDRTCCYPGIEELLKRHDPRCMAIVTNKPYTFTLKILAGLKLAGYFTAVIGGDSSPFKKPDPYPLRQALLQLGARPDQAVMIGDHHTDLHAARAAGVASCFCAYGFGHAANLTPDYYAARPADLLKLFPGAAH